ncbi:SGNH/GDSL hydrolase family protein [Cryptosporangium phraense]|uniref:SGNH/GDSL hydrolase family protein n=1 Tax=Cryptosporangium phraense TaxID=2593070 RepID=A0A545ATM4_9ACTN|nr:SGNH/GDSL hydrolase family protein [Cryptosporangium phraense]TQS44689.1 SGNH/GDSL hydrolase family protein [Cryptosporangium phraense]
MRYAAIGDSFTEGVGDVRPDGTLRGWADRVAEGLAAAAPPVEYANLAIRGRLLRPIVTGQLDAALALDPLPDLMTLNGGGNDMLRPGIHLDDLMTLTEGAVRRCRDAGVRLVLLSGADPTARLPLGRLVRRRGAVLTARTRALAAKYDLTFVSAFEDEEIRHERYWSPDRLHLAPAGHARVAGLVLHALGYGDVPEPAPPAPPAARHTVRYYREHVLPWVNRRLHGRSSGDDRDPKHPVWYPVTG